MDRQLRAASSTGKPVRSMGHTTPAIRKANQDTSEFSRRQMQPHACTDLVP